MSGDHPRTPHRPVSCGALTVDIQQVLDVCLQRSVEAEFRYDPVSPLVVTVRLAPEGCPGVVWHIGRDLLHHGMRALSGLGDVQVWPSCLDAPATAWLRLGGAEAAALFELPVHPLVEWLEVTYQVVPAGTELEPMDWDALAAWLSATPEVPSD
ncbi:SsgA family sporulation/cell division regulator [Streptomyces sp. SID11385]|uniref:SsgA family sporulation/cell division regulator n=1 Tax=Streptomyces sp. SID11385 TaxID=2706031 RepID=UPI0013C60053|nr:SsgA family sporulation/cell division regulator [Streptomyces sp. SID11385]NEA40535.1 SsgA family sporulation/cell division regulator [Streptomyces sp. SID11385]